MKIKMEDQVCSAILGKELKELQVTLDHQFVWMLNPVNPYDVKLITLYQEKEYSHLRSNRFFYPAWTVAELMEKIFKGSHSVHISIMNDQWRVSYDVPNGYSVTLSKLADSLAKMLIYLINEGLVDHDKI